MKKALVSKFVGQRFIEGHMDHITEEVVLWDRLSKALCRPYARFDQTSQMKVEAAAGLVDKAARTVVFELVVVRQLLLLMLLTACSVLALT